MDRPTKFLFLVVLITLSACTVSSEQAIQLPENGLSNAPNNGCIAPIATFSYPANQRQTAIVSNPVFPSIPWEVETPLPNPPSGSQTFDWISVVRSKEEYDEVWIKRTVDSATAGSSKIPTVQFLSYRTDTKKWKIWPDTSPEGSMRSGDLFLAGNGTLWAELSFSKNGYFAVYDEKTGQFKNIASNENIPTGVRLLDDTGIFWIVSTNRGIYRFDAVHQEIKESISIPDLVLPSSLYSKNSALASDGSIYFLNLTGDSTTQLMRFIPSTGQIEHIPYLDFLGDAAFNLFIDHSNRVWLGDLGWMTPDRIWYKLVRSPLFITDKAESALQYTWTRPSLILESSDGLLWFQSENGLTSLDLQNKKWCWFTTEQSNIVEDQQHNLWLIADSKLYRLRLGQ